MRRLCEHAFVGELRIYDREGNLIDFIAMTQDADDPRKWKLARAVALGPGESERAFVYFEGQEP
jgi:hypothetical protein